MTWAVVITGYEPFSHWVHGPYASEQAAEAALRAGGFIEPEDGDGRSRWYDAADKFDAFVLQMRPVPEASSFEPVPQLDPGRWVRAGETWHLDRRPAGSTRSNPESIASWHPTEGIYAAENYGEEAVPGMTPEDAIALARIMRSYQ